MSDSAKPKRQAKPAKVDPSFEECLTNLQQIVQQLEQGELGLAESLQRYEDGVQYLKQCFQQLAKAEQRVEILSELAPDGTAVTEPFDEQSMSLDRKADARSSRRTRKARPSTRRTGDSASDDNMDDSQGLF